MLLCRAQRLKEEDCANGPPLLRQSCGTPNISMWRRHQRSIRHRPRSLRSPEREPDAASSQPNPPERQSSLCRGVCPSSLFPNQAMADLGEVQAVPKESVRPEEGTPSSHGATRPRQHCPCRPPASPLPQALPPASPPFATCPALPGRNHAQIHFAAAPAARTTRPAAPLRALRPARGWVRGARTPLLPCARQFRRRAR